MTRINGLERIEIDPCPGAPVSLFGGGGTRAFCAAIERNFFLPRGISAREFVPHTDFKKYNARKRRRKAKQ